jgi:hypothetical protein
LRSISLQTSDNQSIPFSEALFFPSVNFTKPNESVISRLPVCQLSILPNDTSPHRVKINKTILTYPTIESYYENDLYPGGHWFPKTCRAEQRLAIIVCYRDREQHLKFYLYHMHSFLKQQQLDYTIFVVNQHAPNDFNRAALFNVGYFEAMKLYPFDCFIFHDVDMLPEDRRNIYKCGDNPRHM